MTTPLRTRLTRLVEPAGASVCNWATKAAIAFARGSGSASRIAHEPRRGCCLVSNVAGLLSHASAHRPLSEAAANADDP